MNTNDKVAKILTENSDIWKTESSYFSYLRGCIRLAWMKNPVKLKMLAKAKKQIPNPNYGKPRNHKITVQGAECSICHLDYPMKFIEVDHKEGGTYSLKSVEDIQGFFESICIVSEDDLRIVCKPCHAVLTHAAKYKMSFDQAKRELEFIKVKKEKRILEKLVELEVSPIPKLKKDQEKLLYQLLVIGE